MFKLTPSIDYRISQDLSLNGVLSFSPKKSSLGLGATYYTSPQSKIQLTLKGGLAYGGNELQWKTGMRVNFSYHGLNLSLPFMLGSKNALSNKYSIIFTLSTMALSAIGFAYFIFKDRIGKE